MNILRFVKKSAYITSVLAIIVGIIFLVNPVGASDIIAKALGVVVIIGGVLNVIMYIRDKGQGMLSAGNLIVGVLLIAIGAFLVIYSGITLTLIGFVVSIYLIIDGFVGTDSAIAMGRVHAPGWVAHLILSLIILCGGLLFLFQPFGAITMTGTLLGVSLLIDGIVGLVTSLRVSSAVKEVKKEIEDIVEDVPEEDVK